MMRASFILFLLGSLFTVSRAQDSSYVDMGGALRFNAFYKNWKGQEDNQEKGGELDFDTFMIDAKAKRDGVYLNAQYRFYRGYHFLRYGYLGADLSEDMALKLGVTQVPFGMLSFASNSWFFSIPYYMGLEDDYDAGLVWEYRPGKWDLRAAFFKNSEGAFSGSSPHSARFSYDVVGNSEEVNQGNLRAAYEIVEGWELGLSGQYGGLYNRISQDMGEHWAYAAHIEGDLAKFGVKSEFIQFSFDPAEPFDHHPGTVQMGAYDFPYQVAKKGRIFLGGINYDIEVESELIDGITLYEDFSYFEKGVDGFSDSRMNIVGMRVDAGNFVSYFDVATGKAHPWLGPAWTEAFARGAPDADIPEGELKADPEVEWTTRFNVNLGYYF